MFINLFGIHPGTQNISVRIWFGFDSLNTKILNPFGYLINFDSGSILLFGPGSVRFFGSEFFFPSPRFDTEE